MSVLTEDMKRLVREQRLGYVATVSPDGSPNVSPKGSMTVLDEDTLVFADIESPHTIRNLASEPRTEINVVDPLTRKGYRFRGRGTVLHAGVASWNALAMYREEGADVRRIRAVVIIALSPPSRSSRRSTPRASPRTKCAPFGRSTTRSSARGPSSISSHLGISRPVVEGIRSSGRVRGRPPTGQDPEASRA